MSHRVTLHIAGSIDIEKQVNGESKTIKIVLATAFRKVLTSIEGVQHKGLSSEGSTREAPGEDGPRLDHDSGPAGLSEAHDEGGAG